MASTYTPIMTTTLTSSGALSFTSIPSTYTDIILVASCEGSYGTSTYDQVEIRFNNDTGTNYSYITLGSNSGSVTGNRASNQTFIAATTNSAPTFDGKVSSLIMQLNNYSNTTTYKTAILRDNYLGSNAGDGIDFNVGLWRSQSAINRIDLKVSSSGGTNFLAGSTFTLYGITAA